MQRTLSDYLNLKTEGEVQGSAKSKADAMKGMKCKA
jgi:hypothetical protein